VKDRKRVEFDRQKNSLCGRLILWKMKSLATNEFIMAIRREEKRERKKRPQ
jgi:hypothetical protein